MDASQALKDAGIGQIARLPPPDPKGSMPLEQALAGRRSRRYFKEEPLSLEEIGQLLWSAQGVTSEEGLRAAPSAGAMYPLETYLACAEGLFQYQPHDHAVAKKSADDPRPDLAAAALGQDFIAQAPVSIILTAVYQRTTGRYGDRGRRYVHMDAGYTAENVHLQAEALGLGSVSVGAFDDRAVARALDLPRNEEPLLIIPIGRAGRR